MALKKGDRQNFETLRKAFLNGDAALVEVQRRSALWGGTARNT